jgi:hypothetical protein
MKIVYKKGSNITYHVWATSFILVHWAAERLRGTRYKTFTPDWQAREIGQMAMAWARINGQLLTKLKMASLVVKLHEIVNET